MSSCSQPAQLHVPLLLLRLHRSCIFSCVHVHCEALVWAAKRWMFEQLHCWPCWIMFVVLLLWPMSPGLLPSGFGFFGLPVAPASGPAAQVSTCNASWLTLACMHSMQCFSTTHGAQPNLHTWQGVIDTCSRHALAQIHSPDVSTLHGTLLCNRRPQLPESASYSSIHPCCLSLKGCC
jgi:hypothetical protein